MQQRLEELKKEGDEEAIEYFKDIKSKVESGSYYKDALDWYFFRYLSPICDRTLLIFGAMIAAFVIFMLYQMIDRTFPLVEKMPIIISAKDQAVSFPSLVELRPKEGKKGYDPLISNVDEAVAKYLLSSYVKKREGYDYSDGLVKKINTKFNHIRSSSSPNEFRLFQIWMSKNNKESPIRDFGKNVSKEIKISSVKFIKKEPKNLMSKAKEYFFDKIPTEVEIRFVAIRKEFDKDKGKIESKQKYLAKINFFFGGVDKKDKISQLDFVVKSYKLFKIK